MCSKGFRWKQRTSERFNSKQHFPGPRECASEINKRREQEVNSIWSSTESSHDRRRHTPVHMRLDTHNQHYVALLSRGCFFLRTMRGGKDEAVTRDHREADSSTLGPNLEGILTHSHRPRDAHTGFPIVSRSVEAKAGGEGGGGSHVLLPPVWEILTQP